MSTKLLETCRGFN